MRSLRPMRFPVVLALVGLAVSLVAPPALAPAATVSRTSFALSLDPREVEVTAGDIAEVDVRIVRGRSFSGSVRLSTTGLPAGVTARPGANPIRNLTTLRVATGTVRTGTYNVTVNGVSGTRRASARFLLVILPRLTAAPTPTSPPTPATQPPATAAPQTTTTTAAIGDFTLLVEPASLTVRRGETTRATLRIVRTGGFAEPVLVSADEVPAGLDVQLDANPITGNSATLFVTPTQALSASASFVLRSRSRTVRVPLISTEELGLAAPTTLQANPGATVTGTVTVTRPAGSTTPVQLTVSGLPGASTAFFNPNPLVSGNATITITVATGTASGTYPLTVTVTTGTVTRTAPISLIVGNASGGLTVVASPQSVSVAPGQSVSSTLTVTPPPASGVGLGWGATGNPSSIGVSIAAGTTTATSTTATVTFTVSAGTPAGTYPVTLVASSGSLTGTTIINVVVDPNATTTTTAPAFNFALTPSPSAVTIARGGSNIITVLMSTTGTVGPVSFATSGLPVGVGTSYTLNPSTTGTTLTLNVAGTVTPGVYGFTIIGVAGGVQRSTAATLTVT